MIYDRINAWLLVRVKAVYKSVVAIATTFHICHVEKHVINTATLSDSPSVKSGFADPIHNNVKTAATIKGSVRILSLSPNSRKKRRHLKMGQKEIFPCR